MMVRPTDPSSWLFATVRTLLHRIEVLEERQLSTASFDVAKHLARGPPGVLALEDYAPNSDCQTTLQLLDDKCQKLEDALSLTVRFCNNMSTSFTKFVDLVNTKIVPFTSATSTTPTSTPANAVPSALSSSRSPL